MSNIKVQGISKVSDIFPRQETYRWYATQLSIPCEFHRLYFPSILHKFECSSAHIENAQIIAHFSIVGGEQLEKRYHKGNDDIRRLSRSTDSTDKRFPLFRTPFTNFQSFDPRPQSSNSKTYSQCLAFSFGVSNSSNLFV